MHTQALTKRITISLPDKTYRRMKELVGESSVSAFVADAIDEKVHLANGPRLDPVQSLHEMQREFARFSKKELDEMKRDLRKGLL